MSRLRRSRAPEEASLREASLGQDYPTRSLGIQTVMKLRYGLKRGQRSNKETPLGMRRRDVIAAMVPWESIDFHGRLMQPATPRGRGIFRSPLARKIFS